VLSREHINDYRTSSYKLNQHSTNDPTPHHHLFQYLIVRHPKVALALIPLMHSTFHPPTLKPAAESTRRCLLLALARPRLWAGDRTSCSSALLPTLWLAHRISIAAHRRADSHAPVSLSSPSGYIDLQQGCSTVLNGSRSPTVSHKSSTTTTLMMCTVVSHRPYLTYISTAQLTQQH
jgi:hypothetical protein